MAKCIKDNQSSIGGTSYCGEIVARLTRADGRGNLRPVTVAPVGPGARESE